VNPIRDSSAQSSQKLLLFARSTIIDEEISQRSVDISTNILKANVGVNMLRDARVVEGEIATANVNSVLHVLNSKLKESQDQVNIRESKNLALINEQVQVVHVFKSASIKDRMRGFVKAGKRKEAIVEAAKIVQTAWRF